MKDFVDLHTHTIASGHAYGTISEMIHAAALKELPVFGISDHAPSMRGTMDEVYFWCFKTIPRYVEGVRVLFGCELNIMDYKGTIDLSEKALKRLDYTIASLHDLCLPFGTRDENTSAILGAMENPYVKIIGHPDDSRYPLDLEAVVRGAKTHGKLL
ncbi:MAG: PHP domain-containing protein, partial [Lachnospiraceae bacterium]|nr:PHP domain-containing protein [Lachnospiraceae bacterium]